MQTIILNGQVFNVTTDQYGRVTETKAIKAKSSGFKPVINLWSNGIQSAILAGDLVLQRGQYVQCGEGGPLSRYIGHNSKTGSFNVVHGGTGKQVQDRFLSRVQSGKMGELLRVAIESGDRQQIKQARAKFLASIGE